MPSYLFGSEVHYVYGVESDPLPRQPLCTTLHYGVVYVTTSIRAGYKRKTYYWARISSVVDHVLSIIGSFNKLCQVIAGQRIITASRADTSDEVFFSG